MLWFLEEKGGAETRKLDLRFENLAISYLPEFMKESVTDVVSHALRLHAS